MSRAGNQLKFIGRYHALRTEGRLWLGSYIQLYTVDASFFWVIDFCAIMSTSISYYLRAMMIMFASAAVLSSREQDSTAVTVTSSSAVPVVIISNESIATDVKNQACTAKTSWLF